MNADTWNKWLTLAANIAVIAGIIFLAVELRQNSDMTRAQTRNQLAEQLTELFSLNMHDPDYANVLLRGNKGEELSDVEQYQYSRHRSAWFWYWSNVVYQYQMGLYDETEFAIQVSAIRSDMDAFPGLKAHWCANRVRASAALIEAVEAESLGEFC